MFYLFYTKPSRTNFINLFIKNTIMNILKKLLFCLLLIFCAHHANAQQLGANYNNVSYTKGTVNDDGILGVNLTNLIDNQTTKADFPYYNFYSSNSGSSFLVRQYRDITIKTGVNPNFSKYAVYVDFNANGSFADAGETIISPTLSNSSSQFIQKNFTVPNNVTISILCRMRVVCTSNAETITPDKISYIYGETEDYSFYAEDANGSSIAGCANGDVLTEWNNTIGAYGDFSTTTYAPNSKCEWHIEPVGANAIEFWITLIDTEFSRDHIAIYDGTDNTGKLLGIFSGAGGSQKRMIAYSGKAYVIFTSNATDVRVYKGFQILFNAFNSNCTDDLNPNCYSAGYNITNVVLYEKQYVNPTTCSGTKGNYSSYTIPTSTNPDVVITNDKQFNLGVYTLKPDTNVAMWMDYNQNNVFEKTEYYKFGPTTITNNLSLANVTIPKPGNTLTGTMKMRIRTRQSTDAILDTDACVPFDSGETEDYTLTLVASNPSQAPVASFSASSSNINKGNFVNFYDNSTNTPTSWLWTFGGGVPASSTSKNPTNIKYDAVGCYPVTLKATNTSGNNTKSQTCYINVTEVSTSGCNELFFSEYLEGTSNNKALEIYNPTNNAIALSSYSVELYANGGTTATSTQILSGSIAAYGTYVLANSGAVAGILSLATINSTACSFNGDDAIVLKKGSTIIDVIGEVGIDPGTTWTVGTGSTLDYTLVRNATIDKPSTSWATVQNQWTVNPVNTITNLGQHSSNCNNLATANFDESKLSIFPNPSTNVITISSTKNIHISAITITDLNGRIVKVNQFNNLPNVQVNIADLSKGIYLMKITSKEGAITEKIIKK